MVTVHELKQIVNVVGNLKKISHQLHHQDENACNYGLTSRQEKRVANLEKKAEELAQELKLHAYHQRDPRGASLYLVGNANCDHNYTDGVCIW